MCSNKEMAYPLKIIEMDDFFLNSDDLLSKNAFHNESSTNEGSAAAESFLFEPDLVNTSKVTLLFTDSKNYRAQFEKSHLKLINNIIVLDR